MKNISSTDFKAMAFALGVDDIGITPVSVLDNELPFLQSYLSSACNGQMEYLSKEPEKRVNPELLLSNTRSVVVIAMSYFPRPDIYQYNPLISFYAQGTDYHKVVSKVLKNMGSQLKLLENETTYRVFTDTAPILEKAWAVRAGLGSIGRNSLVQHQRLGTFFFLGILLTDAVFSSYDSPVFEGESGVDRAIGIEVSSVSIDVDATAGMSNESSYLSSRLSSLCINCKACVEACPTGAISAIGNPRLNASLCLSYKTIEEKPNIYGSKNFGLKETFERKTDNLKIFGCDICQQVCPANNFGQKPKPLPKPEFAPKPGILGLQKESILNLSEEDFLKIVDKTAIKRTGLQSLLQDLSLLK